ncbi:hypothetical protein PPSIR1_01077 [Plesiocystis pacifica SIR-1]|uniref:Uncharacterized protein n=2 Tax=Plesiocystis pacifica TaxID=191768 RepID=A6GFL1_9BACT|nr:hypothetical protein PPSIR1_01077 [Plesiocystis pacifica SIR-1]
MEGMRPPLPRRRLALQLALLSGIGLAFCLHRGAAPVQAEGAECWEETQCSWPKNNLMFIVEYSTAMNEPAEGFPGQTRWEASVEALETMLQPGLFLTNQANIAIMRYGHDPQPGVPGTTIPGDASGLVDGHVFDQRWDDERGVYHECVAEELLDLLAATPPPLNGAATGIEPWTRGALEAALAEALATQQDHPEDLGLEPGLIAPRPYIFSLITAGAWTDADGSSAYAPAEADPAPVAEQAFDDHHIPTYVLSWHGDEQAQAAADAVANAGGTQVAIAHEPEVLWVAVTDAIYGSFGDYFPECFGGQPRVLVILDASSAMLDDPAQPGQPGAMGQTLWDQARTALTAPGGFLEVNLGDGLPLDGRAQIGLMVFGGTSPDPGEQRVLVDYGSCTADNMAWALNPLTSCLLPGCEDPWGGPPIVWDFQDGTPDPPGFDLPTDSHMPRCQGPGPGCAGSGRALHLGLALAHQNQADYHATNEGWDALAPVNDATPYHNILIVAGAHESTDAQVETHLLGMVADGITTHVIGLGPAYDPAGGDPLALAQLAQMADWGSGGTLPPLRALEGDELSATLSAIVEGLEVELDPCCAFPSCLDTPEPTTNEPDPVPGDGDTESGTPTDTDTAESTDTTETETETTEESGTRGESESAEESGSSEDEIGDDTETGAPLDTGDATGGGDEASADPIILDRGCACQADPEPGRPLPWALALLLALPLLRRRERSR